MLLVPLFNFFGGLALLHAYLTASGRTSYEICKGAKARPTTPHKCFGPLLSKVHRVRPLGPFSDLISKTKCKITGLVSVPTANSYVLESG